MTAVQAARLRSESSYPHHLSSWEMLSALALPAMTSIASATPAKMPIFRIKPRLLNSSAGTLPAGRVPRNRLCRLKEFRRRRDRVLEAKPRHNDAFGKGAQKPRRHRPVEQHEDAMIGGPAHQAAEGLFQP